MNKLTQTAAAVALASMLLVPSASAQSHRQKSKNTWQNLAYGSAAVGAYGFLSHQQTLGWLGAAGAGYSAYRYEQDRKSQARSQRLSYVHHLRRRHRR